MLAQVKVLREFAGALLRPHADALMPLMEEGIPVDEILAAAKEAGAQLVKEGKMCSETLATVSREVVSAETYVQTSNEYYQQGLGSVEKK